MTIPQRMLLLFSTANLPISRLTIILRDIIICIIVMITRSCTSRNHMSRLLPHRSLIILLRLERFSVGHSRAATATSSSSVQIRRSRQPRHRRDRLHDQARSARRSWRLVLVLLLTCTTWLLLLLDRVLADPDHRCCSRRWLLLVLLLLVILGGWVLVKIGLAGGKGGLVL